MKPDRVWYVVLNSNRLRILRDLPQPGEAAGPEITLQAPVTHLRDALRDAPTRSFASAGGGRRSAVMPSSNPVLEAERTFLHRVFQLLADERAMGAYDAMVVFGSPEIIGLWRDEIPDALSPLVRQEVVKNLIRLPAHELATAVRRLLSE